MAVEQDYGAGKLKLPISGVFRIVMPYVKSLFLEQLRGIWFIVIYLILFQVVLLKLPIVYSVMIGVGVCVVLVGLMMFMEGLRLGLMPFSEAIGTHLPRRAPLPLMLLFAFLLGGLATFAEPAIEVLKRAGSSLKPDDAPLLYSILNDFANQLVACVGTGVGLAVMLGLLRFLYGWSLKILITPTVLGLLAMTCWMHSVDALKPVLGLAWDCGAVTTGPVTVPLVLALGIGVSRMVARDDAGGQGFGIVTLASLFPIVAVMCLGLFHYLADDYIGRPNYKPSAVIAAASESVAEEAAEEDLEAQAEDEYRLDAFTKGDLDYATSEGKIRGRYTLEYDGGDWVLEDGVIKRRGASLVYRKKAASFVATEGKKSWDSSLTVGSQIWDAFLTSARAIPPLIGFLLLTLLLLRQRLPHADEISVGIGFAIVGMMLFTLGLAFGLTPLGGQLGSNIPAAFTRISPWNLGGFQGPLYDAVTGKIVAIVFGFFLGYGATLAEPALNALGATVEKITTGAFRKSLLMQAVAIGVGSGIALGVTMIAYNLPLAWLLVPPYLILIVLTWMSNEQFVNFGWDSAGVTTGPITVPLVLAMGLGIGGNIPGVVGGFGILSLASVGPIISVLIVGMVVRKTSGVQEDDLQADRGLGHAA